MANPLSLLGEIHTAISIIPAAAGLYSFAKYRAIRPETSVGKIYLATLALSAISAFGLSSTGGFNPGHALAIVVLVVSGICLLLPKLGFLGRLIPYLTNLGFSFTYFLLWVPGINETLSRLPPSHPIGNGPDSPPVKAALLAWVVLFTAGSLAQAFIVSRRQARRAIA
ncbi:hypothetical protein QTL95_14665 [Rhizobium sp. S152]|uniref:hypothetical protein n=1 Tax=Rhizobium sp. S152 TaxID=3055038 RepID=UPI0025A9BE4B|nr:hypothetical protein [Rhizobium sp. S152]MDM9627148.1 hypothetical protein [Rhizobium sp. S152]